MRAAIDIGSNSALLLVADGDRVVHDECRVVGLGRGMGDPGVFRPDRMQATLDALVDYAARARDLGVEPNAVRAVATSASRRALNASTFYDRVQRRTGIAVRVISGDEEARLTYLGGLAGITVKPGPVFLCDPGGGSTEIILGEGRDILQRVSLEIGTVRLTDRYLGYGRVDPAALARARQEIDRAFLEVDLLRRPRTTIAVAGSATTLAAASLGLAAYDPPRVHNSLLTRAQLHDWVDRILGASPEARRKLFSASPERADTMLIGACILLRALEYSQRQSVRISDRGLRYGLLAD